MNALKSGLNLVVLSLVAFAGISHAALPIEECKTFLDEELELLCLKSSIEARIEDEIPYYNHAVIIHDYDSDDIGFLSNRLLSLSPAGTVNYDIHYKVYDDCNPAIYFCDYRAASHLYNPFDDRVLDGKILSYDDTELVTYEMKYIVLSGKAYVSIKKRKFDSNYNEINP